MKKIISAVVTVYIAAMALLNYSYAQVENNTLAFTAKKTEKKSAVVFNSGNNKSELVENLKNISPIAIKTFKKKFKNVTVDYWNKITDGYEAKFYINGIKNRAYFDKAGAIIYVMKYYGEDQLPVDTRAIVKETYYDYNIFQVEELTVIADKNTIYIIHLEGKTSWKNVTICNGEMNTLEDINK